MDGNKDIEPIEEVEKIVKIRPLMDGNDVKSSQSLISNLLLKSDH